MTSDSGERKCLLLEHNFIRDGILTNGDTGVVCNQCLSPALLQLLINRHFC
jgi:hypothetical protein